MPQISVIIPTYNAEQVILDTIKSVQQQTFSDFELIVIDDGSKDKTVELIKAVKDERIKVLPYENGGVCVARNRGIKQARGEFISFLDHDDLWTSDKLELQLKALQQNLEAGVAYSQVVRMCDGKVFHPSNTPLLEGNIYPQLLVENFIGNGSNILVRREMVELVGEFDPACPYTADWDYCLRLAAHSPYVVVPKSQIIYQQVSGSMSSKVDIFDEQVLFMIEKAYRAAPEELQPLKKQTIGQHYRYCAELYLEPHSDRTQVIKAQQKLWSAIRTYPPVFLDIVTSKLLYKFLLKRVFPPSTVDYLIQLSKRTFRSSRSISETVQ